VSSTYPFDFPVNITQQGLQPQSPTALQTQLLAAVAATNPGYTANLPGTLIEDVSSTDVAAMSIIDQAKVELVNCLTPYGANQFLLTQLGNIYGLQLGSVTNTSVVVVFSGSVGFVVNQGFLVSDGTNTYAVATGGAIGSGGTISLTAISVSTGSFSVGANTVTQLKTSVPLVVGLTVNNPSTGTPGSTGETYYSFRARLLQAGLAASVGTARYIKTLLTQVSGVGANDVSVQQSGSGIRIIATGGDVYAIAYAIFCSVADIGVLLGSAINSGRNVTVSLFDYPNTYNVLYVNTQVQTVTMSIVWNTTQSNFTGGGAFAGLVQGPIAAYINQLAPGQVINVLEMNELFQEAVAGVLDPALLTRLVFSVSINSVYTPPATGTFAVSGDPESNFNCVASGITVTQG
jgi:hypothetical protein